jgi:hypothetical protein
MAPSLGAIVQVEYKQLFRGHEMMSAEHLTRQALYGVSHAPTQNTLHQYISGFLQRMKN